MTLSKFGGKQRHAFDEASVAELPGIEEPKWRPIDQNVEFPFRRSIVTDHVNVAEDVPVELRRVKDLPPDVFEGPDNPGTRESFLNLLGRTCIPRQNQIIVTIVEWICDIDPKLAVELLPERLMVSNP